MGAVSVRDVAVGFGDVGIFKNLSMEIEKGEFIVLLGPSGCGKSTLLNAIAGLLDVKAGQIWIDGKNVTWSEPKDRGIGMVFQSYSLYPRMSVEMNLSFGLRIAKVAKDEIARRVAKAASCPPAESPATATRVGSRPKRRGSAKIAITASKPSSIAPGKRVSGAHR